MGQFYKGTGTELLDGAMFKLPYELMGAAIDKKDKEVETTATANSALSSLLQAKGLQADNPRLQEIIGGYTNKIEDLSSNIYKDAMNAARYMPHIENLKKDIHSNWKMGEVSKIEGNLASFNAWEEDAKKQIDKAGNKITPGQWEALRAQKLQEYANKGGVNYRNSNQYNTFQGEALLEKKNGLDFFDELMKGATGGHNTISWDNDQKLWQIKGERGTEGWTDADLKKKYQSALLADPNQLRAFEQLNSLGIDGYQEPLYDQQGKILIDDTKPNAFTRELDAAKEKYGMYTVKTSNSKLMNDAGKQEYAYGIKQRDEEQPVGFTFSDTYKHPLTHDYSTYINTRNSIINSKNALFGTIATKLGLTSAEDRVKLGQAIGRGDYSAILNNSNILDGASYVEQFKDLKAEQALVDEVTKDFNKYVTTNNKMNSKGQVAMVVTNKGKQKTIWVDPKTRQGQATLYNSFIKQSGYTQNPVELFTADNTSAGISPKATAAIGKTLNSLKGSLVLNLHTEKDKGTVYLSPKGEGVRLVGPGEDKKYTATGTYIDGKVYKKDEKGNFVIPALTPEGGIQAQNLINLGLASGLEYKEDGGSAEEGEPGGKPKAGATTLTGLRVQGQKPQNLSFYPESARVVDKNVNGKPSLAIPVSGGNFHVVATLDANTVQQPELQEFIRNPGNVAARKLSSWKQKIVPNMSERQTYTVNEQGVRVPSYRVGRSKGKGWYVIKPDGTKVSSAEGVETEEKLIKLYYDSTRD